jgi:hypothetical protein
LLHGGKTFKTGNRHTFAQLQRTASGNHAVCVVLAGRTIYPCLDDQGRPIWPRTARIPHGLTIQVRRAFRYKMRLDADLPPC